MNAQLGCNLVNDFEETRQSVRCKAASFFPCGLTKLPIDYEVILCLGFIHAFKASNNIFMCPFYN